MDGKEIGTGIMVRDVAHQRQSSDRTSVEYGINNTMELR